MSSQFMQMGFDLVAADSDRYRLVARALYGWGDAVKATRSQWLVATTLPEAEIRRRLDVIMGGRDKHLVTNFTGCVVHQGMPPEVIRWLERYGFLKADGDSLAA